MKNLLSIILSFILIFSITGNSYAYTSNEAYDVCVINKNQISIFDKTSGDRVIINVVANSSIMKTEIKTKNGNNYDGEIIWNKKNNTIYSSYTQKTVNVDTLTSSEKNLKSVESSKRYRISYKELSDFVSDTSNTYTIAAAIIVVVAALVGGTIETGPGVIMSLISASIVIITWGLNAQRSDKGIYVDVDKHLIKKHQGNQIYTVEVYRISNVGTY